MLFILFLKVEKEHIFGGTTKNNVAYILGKNVQRQHRFQQKYIKTTYNKLLLCSWKFTTQTENGHPNGNWPISIFGKSLFIKIKHV